MILYKLIFLFHDLNPPFKNPTTLSNPTLESHKIVSCSLFLGETDIKFDIHFLLKNQPRVQMNHLEPINIEPGI